MFYYWAFIVKVFGPVVHVLWLDELWVVSVKLPHCLVYCEYSEPLHPSNDWTKLSFQVVAVFALIQDTACLSEVSKVHLVSDYSQKLGCCTQHLVGVLGQQHSFSRSAEPGRIYCFLDDRGIYRVQILSDFQVQSKTTPFSFPIHIIAQKSVLQIPLNVTSVQE